MTQILLYSVFVCNHYIALKQACSKAYFKLEGPTKTASFERVIKNSPESLFICKTYIFSNSFRMVCNTF